MTVSAWQCGRQKHRPQTVPTVPEFSSGSIPAEKGLFKLFQSFNRYRSDLNLGVHRISLCSENVTATAKADQQCFEIPYVAPGAFLVPWGPSLSINA